MGLFAVENTFKHCLFEPFKKPASWFYV